MGWIRPVGCGTNGCDTMFGTLVTLVCGLDVPDVRLERVATAANAHLSEVANSVLCLGKAYDSNIRTKHGVQLTGE